MAWTKRRAKKGLSICKLPFLSLVKALLNCFFFFITNNNNDWLDCRMRLCSHRSSRSFVPRSYNSLINIHAGFERFTSTLSPFFAFARWSSVWTIRKYECKFRIAVQRVGRNAPYRYAWHHCNISTGRYDLPFVSFYVVYRVFIIELESFICRRCHKYLFPKLYV